MNSDQTLAEILSELQEQSETLKKSDPDRPDRLYADELRGVHGEIIDLHLANITFCIDTLISHFCSEDQLEGQGYPKVRQRYEEQLMFLRDKAAHLRGLLT